MSAAHFARIPRLGLAPVVVCRRRCAICRAMNNGSTPSAAKTPTSILPILSVNFVGTLGFSIVVPFMVFLVADWGGNAIIYGALASTYSAFQLIGAPILGRWSDSIGRRKVLLLSQLGTMVSWVIFLTAFLLPVDALFSVDSGLLGQFSLTLAADRAVRGAGRRRFDRRQCVGRQCLSGGHHG